MNATENSFLIEILPSQVSVDEFSGVSERTGREFTMRNQFAYAHLKSGEYPVRFKISLDKGQLPYPAGKYRLLPSSLKVGNYDQLQIGAIHLDPVDVD